MQEFFDLELGTINAGVGCKLLTNTALLTNRHSYCKPFLI